MAEPKNKGVLSDSSSPNYQSIITPSSHRPAKVQKTSTIAPIITQFDEFQSNTYQQQHKYPFNNTEFGASSSNYMAHDHSPQTPHFSVQEPQPEDGEDAEPFCFYQETHVQESLNTYSIWHARNQAVFEDDMIMEAAIIQRAQSILQAYHQANLPQSQQSSPVQQSPPSNRALGSGMHHQKLGRHSGSFSIMGKEWVCKCGHS